MSGPYRAVCDWHGCVEPATTVLRFRDTRGHIHDCAPHTAYLREFCDVSWSAPMPCRLSHEGGDTWVAAPPALS